MALTYTAIATATVTGATAANIEFTNIPGTYTDLLIKCSLRGDRAASETQRIDIQFNNSTSNLSSRHLRILEGSANSNTETTNSQFGAPGAGNTASIFSNDEIYIPNYAGSGNKTISIDNVSENNESPNFHVFSYLVAGLWSNSAAITSIKLLAANAGTNLVQYSSATLYGIKNTV